MTNDQKSKEVIDEITRRISSDLAKTSEIVRTLIEGYNEVIQQKENTIIRQGAHIEAVVDKNYWMWQGDGEDHLESLSCPVIIRPQDFREHIDQTIREAKLEALREATKRTCSYCATPVDQLCSVATMQQGSWVHHIHNKLEWGEHCDAGSIHSMIEDLEQR